jgi:methionyl-tRNA formyltransferase
LHISPVKEFALEKNIPILQPGSLKLNSVDLVKRTQAEAAYQQLANTDFDVMVVVAYGLILPQAVLDLAEQKGRHGCFNIHASILPRWRGAAPIQRAIEAGDTKTGVSIMKMDLGLDTGDTVLVRELDIAQTETSVTLHDRLAKLGAELIVQTLETISNGEPLSFMPQAQEGMNYAEKILKTEADIDWQLSAVEIDRRIRAFNPFPGASSALNGAPIKFWLSRIPQTAPELLSGQLGEVVGRTKDGVLIQCGNGLIEILEMQKPGGKKISANACIKTLPQASKVLRFHKE